MTDTHPKKGGKSGRDWYGTVMSQSDTKKAPSSSMKREGFNKTRAAG